MQNAGQWLPAPTQFNEFLRKSLICVNGNIKLTLVFVFQLKYFVHRFIEHFSDL